MSLTSRTPDIAGRNFHDDKSFQPVPYGNQLVNNVGKGGPGAGREVMACGSQGQHGSAAPGNAPAKNRDILSQYGPDYRK
jgi:hypothetical protein